MEPVVPAAPAGVRPYLRAFRPRAANRSESSDSTEAHGSRVAQELTWTTPASRVGGMTPRSSGRPPSLALVTGCPRSGTTAVLQWLGGQPGVSSLDESRILFAAHRFLDEVDRFTVLADRRRQLLRLARSAVLEHYAAVCRGSPRVLVDKEPLEPIALPDGGYDRFLGHVRALLPTLRILYLVRHPVPTIWSMMNRRWGYSLASGEMHDFSLDDCIATWRENAALGFRLRDERRVRLSRFEDLISDPSAESDRFLRFLGVRGGSPFAPQPTASVAFDAADRARILDETATERLWLGF